jgi:Ca2+-binding RTX toxin-like protein
MVSGTPVDAATLTGGASSDLIFGTNRTDKISGKDGGDFLFGKKNPKVGPDVVGGGSGSDQLFGGPNRDEIKGGADNDYIQDLDGTGRDKLNGGLGDDIIVTLDDAGDDVICGDGNDTVFVDPVDDVESDCEVVATADGSYFGYLVKFGSPLSETQPGTAVPDWILTGGGGGTVNADAGNDRVSAAGGIDVVNGGLGVDYLVDDDGEPGDTLNGDEENDILVSADGVADTLDCGAGTGDIAIADPTDDLSNCESLFVGSRKVISG